MFLNKKEQNDNDWILNIDPVYIRGGCDMENLSGPLYQDRYRHDKGQVCDKWYIMIYAQYSPNEWLLMSFTSVYTGTTWWQIF